MIVRLDAGRFGGRGGVHSLKQFFFKFKKTTGTWIAVSPDEIIPEKYKKYIQEDKVIRSLNNIPLDWTMLKLFNSTNNFRSFADKVEMDIILYPRTKYIRKISSYGDRVIMCLASKDLGYPKTYYVPPLRYRYDEKRIISDDNWTLIFLGSEDYYSESDKTIERFKSTLDPDVTFID